MHEALFLPSAYDPSLTLLKRRSSEAYSCEASRARGMWRIGEGPPQHLVTQQNRFRRQREKGAGPSGIARHFAPPVTGPFSRWWSRVPVTRLRSPRPRKGTFAVAHAPVGSGARNREPAWPASATANRSTAAAVTSFTAP